MPATKQDHPRVGIALLAASVAAGVVLRLTFGLGDNGIYWPDEIYQSIEPAHRLVFGYGLVAWEFVEGARNWALPGLVGMVLAAARAVGIDSPAAYLGVIRVVFILISGATAAGVYRLARAYDATPLAAAAGASVFALAGPVVYFGHRAMSETASALPVAFGLALAIEAAKSERWRARLWVGASLLGIAVLLRLQNAVFCVGLLGILAGRRQWRLAAEALGVLVVWALLYGLLDKLTWGGWFHSALKYLQFNLVEGKAAQWGTAPFLWYLEVLWRAMPAVFAALVFGVACSIPRARGLALTALAFFLIHAWTPHKELRFLLPMLPVVAALAAVGLSWLAAAIDPGWLKPGAAVLVLTSAASGVAAPRLTFGELGAYEALKPNASAWNDFADVNRLLLRAHEQPDLCGLKLESAHQAWSGGQTYLHRDVPFYAHNGPPREAGHFNYVISGASARGTLVARDGRHLLLKIADGCVPDPHYTARLP